MKNKYQRMTKEEKQKLKEKYYNTEKGKIMKGRFSRLYLYGIMGIILSAVLLFMAIKDNGPIWDYIISITLLISSLVFIISPIKLKGTELNKFALKQK